MSPKYACSRGFIQSQLYLRTTVAPRQRHCSWQKTLLRHSRAMLLCAANWLRLPF